MKHIGWCLEQISQTCGAIPQEVKSQEDRDVALGLIEMVEDLTVTLVEILQYNGLEKMRQSMEAAPEAEARTAAVQLASTIADLNEVVRLLQSDIEILKNTLKKEPEKFRERAENITMTIAMKLGDDMGELRREFQVAMHTPEVLEQLVSNKAHLAEMLQ